MDDVAKAREDLAKIREMMEDSRRVIEGGGAFYVLWGVLMIAALLVSYGHVVLGWGERVMFVWPMAIGAGWIGTLWLGRRAEAKAPVSTPASRSLGAIWIGVGITATILGLLGPATGAIRPESMSGVMASVLGTGFFASGLCCGGSWLRLLGIAWWVGAVAMLVWPGPHALIVLAAMLLVLSVVPGLILLRHSTRSAA